MADTPEIEKLVQRLRALRTLAARAARESPNDARARFGAGMAYRISGDLPSALAEFRHLCALEPDNTHYRYELGVTQEYLGRFDDAGASYAAALRAEPLNYKARHALVQLQKQSLANNQIAALERLFEGHDEDGWRALHYGHALAKTFDDLGDLAKSFEWLERAKRRRHAIRPYDKARETALATAAMKFAALGGPACDSLEPIFVTGLPRTGTTLIDRVLSSHGDVASAGEIANFAQLLQLLSGAASDVDMFNRSARIDFARLGSLYIDSTRPLTGHSPRFIDKAPSNYLLAGPILRALPNARVICMRRHPLDAVLSNYKQIFPFDDRYYDYVYDLQSAAHKVVQFERVVRHWSSVLPPDRFMVLQYEDLVTNQEARTRELIAFCGLGWDDRCLAFHENAAGVATPSARQVRSAMYASAVGRSAQYGALLDPARAVLEKAGLPLD